MDVNRRDRRTVEDLDRRTYEALERAEEALQLALKQMPNHVLSRWDPRESVPLIDDALRKVHVAQRAYHETPQPA